MAWIAAARVLTVKTGRSLPNTHVSAKKGITTGFFSVEYMAHYVRVFKVFLLLAWNVDGYLSAGLKAGEWYHPQLENSDA